MYLLVVCYKELRRMRRQKEGFDAQEKVLSIFVDYNMENSEKEQSSAD